VIRGLKTPLVLTLSTIRKWRAEDAVDLAKHANDADVAANLRDAFQIHTQSMTRTYFSPALSTTNR
jgi:hypothetical protein